MPGPTHLHVEDVAGADQRLHHVPPCAHGQVLKLYYTMIINYNEGSRRFALAHWAACSLTGGVHDALRRAGRTRGVPGCANRRGRQQKQSDVRVCNEIWGGP